MAVISPDVAKDNAKTLTLQFVISWLKFLGVWCLWWNNQGLCGRSSGALWKVIRGFVGGHQGLCGRSSGALWKVRYILEGSASHRIYKTLCCPFNQK
jgi:hypothetical protein